MTSLTSATPSAVARPKRSRDTLARASPNPPSMSTPVAAAAAAARSSDEERQSSAACQLAMLKTDLDSLRAHLTCKICDHLLYQPFTIACGHTYCYTCLSTWFVNNRARKTCPDCRIIVKEPPAPAYVIRDMASVFIARAELLLPGDTLQKQHQQRQKDEADAVQADKDNKDARTGGLFKGCFRPHPHHARGPSLQVVRDQEDGVDRCPVCTWELEDGGCTQCGLIFDETGEVSWGDSFTGFSDMDDMSEHDTEGLDAMDVEEADYDDYGHPMDDWNRYPADPNSFMMRRFLEGAMPGARRRPMTHSEAGSRHSYSQSVMSDVYGDEMDTLEEEDEDDLDNEEDSSMNDFIDDDEVAASSSASAESSTPGPEPQPSRQRARTTARIRRVVESETSSTISSVVEEEDEEDEEDQGPVRRGARNPPQSRTLQRANASRSSHGASSTTSTDISTEDPDEEELSLLREEGWVRQRDDDEMGEDDEDDSDGARTTVGWEPLANSNDRSRMGGSLTPTADHPRPSAPIRPPSRAGNVRVINTSRGLRRRPSVLSSSTVNYEDGEADDDDSDQDGDLDMAINALRTRRSHAQLRNSSAAFVNPVARFSNASLGQADAANEVDTDENSDTSQTGRRQRGPRTQRREYDPRISWMFAAHQQALQQHNMQDVLIDIESRAITPLSRPRTRNRNRTSPAQTYSPFMAPARLRTPLMEDSQIVGPGLRGPLSPPRRSAMSPAQFAVPNAATTSRFERTPSSSSNSNASTIMTPSSSATSSQHTIDSIAQTQASAALDMIDRPQSRVGARPTSANSRRNSAGFQPMNPPFPHAAIGLHVPGSSLPPFQARGNPWAAYVQARNLRSRNSRQVLREQSSVATVRPVSSRVNIRETGNPPQSMRPQTSRMNMNLRPQPSRRQLNNQASTRTLRASEHARPPPSPAQEVHVHHQPATRSMRQPTLTPDERETRARELVETRRRAIAVPSNTPARTNPFAQSLQRPGNPIASTIIQQPTSSQHIRSNSSESMQSAHSSSTASGAPISPALSRRRSNRMMSEAPPSVLPGAHRPQQYMASPPVYTNSYPRLRQGQSSAYQGQSSAYQGPMNNNRTLNPMTVGPLI